MERSIIHTADPLAEYRALRQEIDVAISSVLEGSSYVLGDPVRLFEEAFADRIGVGHGVGVNSGTDAIHLSSCGRWKLEPAMKSIDRFTYRCGHGSCYLHGRRDPGAC